MGDETADLFGAIDINQDQVLSREEFERALRCGLVAPGSRPGTVSRPTTCEVWEPPASAKLAEPSLAAKIAKAQELQAKADAEKWVALDKIPVPPEFQQAVAEAQARIVAAKQKRIQLGQDGEMLRKENEELKQVVAKARANVERVILKKRADNVQMLADNAELEHFTIEARKLAEQKAKLNPSKSIDGNSDWEILQKNNAHIRRKLERVLQRPQRMQLGGEMESPRSNLSSLEATPRIDAVQEWRASSTTVSAFGSPNMSGARTGNLR